MVTGTYEFACLVAVHDPTWWTSYGHLLEANWETKRLRRYSSLDGAGIEQLVSDPSWSNEGLFAFIEGLRRLRRIRLPAGEGANDREDAMNEGAFYFGNAATDAKEHRGWVIGQFMEDGDVRQTDGVEIKWGVHSAGEERADWQGDETRITVLLLVKGRFRLDLRSEPSF